MAPALSMAPSLQPLADRGVAMLANGRSGGPLRGLREPAGTGLGQRIGLGVA